MKGKHPRYDMIGAINFWCSKNKFGYFTYIEKKTKAELEAIVTQYNINVDEMLFEIDKEREEAANIIPKMQQKIQKNVDYILGKIEMLESLLNDEQKEKTIEVNKTIYITDDNYRLPACADDRASVYEHPGNYTIYHLALENDDYYMNYGIYANGLLVETCSKNYLLNRTNMSIDIK
jgi:hypothetical protein